MATFGIGGDVGFYDPNLTEVMEDVQQDFKDYFGEELNVGDNSLAGILIKIQAGREYKAWKQLAATYNSQTINGAEGEFLDEMYAYQGVYRNSASKGSGNIIIETDNTAEDIDVVVAEATVSTNSGLQYVTETTRTMSEYVKAYKIDGSDLEVGTYTFTVVNSYNTSSTSSYSLISNEDADRIIFFTNLKTFFEGALPDDVDSIIVDSTEGGTSLHVGFTQTDDNFLLRGTEETFELTFGTLRIGNRYSEHAVLAVETGYNPVASTEVDSIIPVPDGFISVVNIDDFFSGTDFETDAAYSARAEQQADSPNSGTRPAIVAALLQIDNVSGASLDKIVDETTGVVTIEPILFGGETEDIAQVLYSTQPANNQYIGDISYKVTTDDGKTETIQFSRGVDLNISIRVTYKTLNGIPLATSEQDAIRYSVEDVNGNLSVGGIVFNGQVAGAVFDVNPQRFTQMTVYMKLEDESDDTYLTTDYIPNSTELPTLSADRVEIIQVN